MNHYERLLAIETERQRNACAEMIRQFDLAAWLRLQRARQGSE